MAILNRKRIVSTVLGLGALALAASPLTNKVVAPQAQAASPSGDVWLHGSFPVENFQGYTSPFGYRISPTGGYSTEFHSGLDFAAPSGSYIRNWWNGRVISVSDNTACGTSVRVQSGSWIHVYCHMQGYVESGASGPVMVDRAGGVRIAEGQQVTAGQRIGRVGMTGRTTGPHLHWTLKYQGKFVDPATVLRTMYAAQGQASQISSRPQ
ncbi:M23 family metallopeptidase [Lyngbya confervoides]|uniref:M23 family metallopeptidase n=1 Tax=Lyngbya confervoides BDU141951 TaxID=1574623 RepID=A0ABD4SXM4_9CYAN|nr:M23 family metallopeptidase [Lyngbya confervoides]MCM1981260.1 M23 family metallopeptidase [Lyngbya confervoides BDU141951]